MNPGIVRRAGLLSWLMTLAGLPASTRAPESPGLLPIEFQHSLEYRWLGKPVLRERALDDLNDPATWQFQGTGTLSFRTAWLVAAGDVPPGAAAPGACAKLIPLRNNIIAAIVIAQTDPEKIFLVIFPSPFDV